MVQLASGLGTCSASEGLILKAGCPVEQWSFLVQPPQPPDGTCHSVNWWASLEEALLCMCGGLMRFGFSKS